MPTECIFAVAEWLSRNTCGRIHKFYRQKKLKVSQPRVKHAVTKCAPLLDVLVEYYHMCERGGG
eukprot:6200886-Pleurochrysis_carterae.AAC.2